MPREELQHVVEKRMPVRRGTSVPSIVSRPLISGSVVRRRTPPLASLRLPHCPTDSSASRPAVVCSTCRR